MMHEAFFIYNQNDEGFCFQIYFSGLYRYFFIRDFYCLGIRTRYVHFCWASITVIIFQIKNFSHAYQDITCIRRFLLKLSLSVFFKNNVCLIGVKFPIILDSLVVRGVYKTNQHDPIVTLIKAENILYVIISCSDFILYFLRGSKQRISKFWQFK